MSLRHEAAAVVDAARVLFAKVRGRQLARTELPASIAALATAARSAPSR